MDPCGVYGLQVLLAGTVWPSEDKPVAPEDPDGEISRGCSIWMSGVNGCQGTPWSEELDGKELHEALGGERDLELRGFAVFWNIVDLESIRLSTLSTTSVVLC